MADFPQSHVTHTTTTTTVTSSRIQLDINHIKTIPGILCIVEMVLSLIVFICAISACSVFGSLGSCGWAGFVSFIGLLLALTWLLFYLFHVQDAVATVPWLLVELIAYGVWTFFFFISGIAMAVGASDAAGLARFTYWPYGKIRDALGAGAFFAFLTTLVFGFHTFLLFRLWYSQRGTHATGSTAGPHP